MRHVSFLAAMTIAATWQHAVADDVADPDSSSFRGLGDLPGGHTVSMALAISGDGRVVVGFSDAQSGSVAFSWSGGEMRALVGPDGRHIFSIAHAVSRDGEIIVGSATIDGRTLPFRFDEHGMSVLGLGKLGESATLADAWSASHDGLVIVGSVSCRIERARGHLVRPRVSYDRPQHRQP